MKHKKGTGGGASNRDKNIDEIADKYAAAKEKRLNKRKVRPRDKSKAPSFLDKLVKMIAPPKDVTINAKTRSMLSSLMITEAELDELRDIFDSVDVDQASEMDFDEFFELIDEPRNSFTDYIFTLIDNVEKSGIEIIPEMERIEEEIENDAPGTAFYARGYLTFDDFVQVVHKAFVESVNPLAKFAKLFGWNGSIAMGVVGHDLSSGSWRYIDGKRCGYGTSATNFKRNVKRLSRDSGD